MSILRSLAVAAAVISLANAAPAVDEKICTTSAALPTVTLDAGVIVGTTTSVPSATASVYQFLGVPFAVSPPTRFAKPDPVKPWSNVLNTQTRAPACMEQFMGTADAVNITKTIFAFPDAVESEDCLYLNIFVPATSTKNKAVMNWIFPGNLFFGDASRPMYDGSSFAAHQDVIVVAGNYRTNAFGFSNSPEIPIAERNAGFYDQRLVLDWIQRNIEKFGGSKDKVTIFGESSGSASVDRLVANNNAPPFHAAIAQSGSASVSAYPNYYESSWPALVAAVNCTGATSELACVRAVDAFTIKSIIESDALIFGPENDNFTQFATPILSRRTKHQAANVPYMIGHNGGEGYPFMLGIEDITTAIYYDLYNPTDAQISAISEAYPIVTDAATNTNNSFDVVSQLFTDVYFGCPAGYIARSTANAGYPMWRYFFNESYPNLQLLSGVDLHSYHTIECALVFGTYPTEGATAQEIAMSKFLQTTWANFAKNPWAGPGWRQVAAGGSETSVVRDIGQFTGGLKPSVSLISEKTLDSRCALFQPQYTTVDYAAF